MKPLPPLPNIREIIRFYKLRALRSLSQNFLLDMNINKKIVRKAGKLKDCVVIEVGPGPGGITRAILERDIERLIVIEKDKRFLESLEYLGKKSEKNLRVVHGDVLKFNMEPVIPEEFTKPWTSAPPRIHIIGNLPFSVSTPLIIRYLRAMSERTGAWKYGRTPLTLTFQKEVAERIVSPILTDERCRLSVICQHLCKVSLEFVIPGKAFTPAPKVDVGVVKFVPLVKPEIELPFNLVEKVLRNIFQFRQKKSIKGVETLFPLHQSELAIEMFERSGVNPETKSFMLTMEEFRRLCLVYNDICDRHAGLIYYDHRSQESARERQEHKRIKRQFRLDNRDKIPEETQNQKLNCDKIQTFFENESTDQSENYSDEEMSELSYDNSDKEILVESNSDNADFNVTR